MRRRVPGSPFRGWLGETIWVVEDDVRVCCEGFESL